MKALEAIATLHPESNRKRTDRRPAGLARTSACLQLLLITAFMMLGLTGIRAQIPAFPGAEGFGAYANGGRGGDVYYVTNLNNNGSGSLRAGLDTAPPEGRTIVFAVSGYIPVVSDTNFDVPSNVTIAGQTAPGDGVGLRGGRMLISGSDVVMRHFRIRHGRNGTGGDCLNIAASASNTIVDHVSMMFSTDENFSFFSNAINNFTMQSSSSTWGMERHNAGGLWDLQNGSCIDSLWAHHRTRNPKARPYGLLEWINNVTFHWRGEGFIMGDSQTPADWKTNAIGNYYISIDDPDEGFGVKNTAFTKARVSSDGVPNYSLFLEDTLFDNNDNGVVDGTDQGYGIVAGSEFTPGDPAGSNRYYRATSAFPGASGPAAVTIDDPLTAYKKVISSVGPLRLDANHTGPVRDELDSLLIDSVVNQYSVLVQKDGKVEGEDPNRPNNGEQHLADAYGITNNGFGTLNSTAAPADEDLDGMPDYWENTLGWNAGAQDHNTAMASSGGFVSGLTFFPASTPAGYTRLEEYLHFKAIPHASIAANGLLEVDLRRFTSGFSESPAFTLSNVSNGSAVMLSDGYTARFTPDTDYSGRCRFDFTVTDAEGSSWTQTFAVLASGQLAPPAAPSDPVATAASSYQIDLSWTDNANNENGFKIERSTDNLSFTEIADLVADTTSYSDGSLAPASTYYYRVKAYNGAGESGYSSTASTSTPAGPPLTPNALSAAPGNSRVILGWSPAAGADGYQVKRSPTFGGPYSTVGTATGTGFEDYAVTNGITYYYVVSATNAYGESGNSNQANATPLNAVTYPAEDQSYGNGTVFESVNAGFNGSGYVNFPPADGFLQFDDVDGGTDGTVTLRFRYALGAATSRTGVLVVNGVSQGITFDPTGAWTTWVTMEALVSINPGGGNTIRLESTGEDLANIDELTVVDPDNGSDPPTAIYRVNSGGSADGPFAADAYFSGGGNYSTTASIDTSAAYDPAPAGVYQTERNGNFAYAFPDLNPGGLYTIRLHFAEIFWSNPGSRTFDVAVNGTLVLDDFDIVATTGAKNRALVREYVFAADGNGQLVVQYTTVQDNAVCSGVEILANPTSGPPAAPTGLAAQAGDSQVTLAWNSTPGATRYSVHRSTTSGGGYGILASGISSASFTDTTVTNGTSYYYVVTASNEFGESPTSDEASATPQVAAPGAPGNLSAAPADTVVVLDWDPVSGADSYRLKRSDTPGGPYATLATGLSTPDYTDSGLAPGSTYHYVVSALNAGGESPDSAEVAATIRPDPPTGLTATPGDARVSLGWSTTAGATSYSVLRSTTSGGPYTTVASGLAGTSYTNFGLSNGTTYYYLVLANNEGGTSPLSAEAGATPQIPPPAPPTDLVAAAGAYQVDLTWSASPDASSYTVKRSITSGGPYDIVAQDLTTPGFTDTGLDADTTYFYVVTASNAGGESGASNEAGATPFPEAEYGGRAVVAAVHALGIEFPVGDSGSLPTEGGTLENSMLTIDESGVAGEIGHAFTIGQADRTRSEATVADLRIDAEGVLIEADFLMARALAAYQQGGSTVVVGGSEIGNLSVAGTPITVTGEPNQVVSLPLIGQLVIDEQLTTGTSITVNALHITLLSGADIVVASAYAAYDSIELPPAIGDDQVSGGGWVADANGDKIGNFSLSGGYEDGVLFGSLNFRDSDTGMKVKGTGVTYYGAGPNPNSRRLEGSCEIDGTDGFTFVVIAEDNGEPGDADTFSIDLSDGYHADGTLGGGNVQVHVPGE